MHALQYAATVALNCQEIKCNPERVSNSKAFLNRYKWNGTNSSPKVED